MTSNPMNQSPEDQFLHWRQDMGRKQEEQARHMRELQGRSKCLQRENDKLRAQIGESHDLGKDVRDSNRAVHQIAHNKRKEPIVPNDVDTITDDELSSGSSLLLSLSSTKNTRAKLRKRPSHRPAFSNTVSGASCRARREVGGG